MMNLKEANTTSEQQQIPRPPDTKTRQKKSWIGVAAIGLVVLLFVAVAFKDQLLKDVRVNSEGFHVTFQDQNPNTDQINTLTQKITELETAAQQKSQGESVDCSYCSVSERSSRGGETPDANRVYESIWVDNTNYTYHFLNYGTELVVRIYNAGYQLVAAGSGQVAENHVQFTFTLADGSTGNASLAYYETSQTLTGTIYYDTYEGPFSVPVELRRTR